MSYEEAAHLESVLTGIPRDVVWMRFDVVMERLGWCPPLHEDEDAEELARLSEDWRAWVYTQLIDALRDWRFTTAVALQAVGGTRATATALRYLARLGRWTLACMDGVPTWDMGEVVVPPLVSVDRVTRYLHKMKRYTVTRAGDAL